MATAPPLPNVTRAHLQRGCDNYKPPLLHFGWSFDPDALIKWGAKNGIDTTERCQEFSDGPIIEEFDSMSTVTNQAAMEISAEKAGTPDLRPTFKTSVRANGNFIVISSKYSFLRARGSLRDCSVCAVVGSGPVVLRCRGFGLEGGGVFFVLRADCITSQSHSKRPTQDF